MLFKLSGSSRTVNPGTSTRTGGGLVTVTYGISTGPEESAREATEGTSDSMVTSGRFRQFMVWAEHKPVSGKAARAITSHSRNLWQYGKFESQPGGECRIKGLDEAGFEFDFSARPGRCFGFFELRTRV